MKAILSTDKKVLDDGNVCTKDCTKELTERQRVILEMMRLSATEGRYK